MAAMRSASVATAFKEAQKKLVWARREVAELEEGRRGEEKEGEEDLSSVLSEVLLTLSSLSKTLSSAPEMDLWKKKVNTALSEQRELATALAKHLETKRTEKEDEAAKKALFDRRYDLDSVRLDTDYAINASASTSVSFFLSFFFLIFFFFFFYQVSMLGQYLEMGRSTVAEFRRQREMLEKVQARLVIQNISNFLNIFNFFEFFK